MKKLLLTLGLAAFVLSAKSQIIVTGIMADPSGTDASVTAGVKAYEYAQFMATENINFATTKFSVVFLYETTSTPQPSDGWASGAQGLTYQMNLTSGTVNKGEIFYVGGDGLKIWGASSTDISAAKWIRSIDYAKNVDDAGTGTSKTALLGNSTRANGIAVFSGVTVSETSVPLDVVFFGGTGTNHYTIGPPEKGFRITNNDFFKTADGEFFAKGTNTNTIPLSAAADLGKFIKFGGDYTTTTNKWDSPRTSTLVVLNNSSTLTDIETGATTLPVTLTSFTAKANKAGAVNLAWSTASEQNNAYFEVTRATDGVNFTKISQVAGSGNANTTQNYSTTDSKPVAGTNYYRLKQVDNDGKFALSSIVSATVGLGNGNLTVSVAANRSAVKINYTAAADGNASFSIYNTAGVKLTTVNKTVSAGQNQIEIPVALGGSIHILKATQAGLTSSSKF